MYKDHIKQKFNLFWTCRSTCMYIDRWMDIDIDICIYTQKAQRIWGVELDSFKAPVYFM